MVGPLFVVWARGSICPHALVTLRVLGTLGSVRGVMGLGSHPLLPTLRPRRSLVRLQCPLRPRDRDVGHTERGVLVAISPPLSVPSPASVPQP